MLYVLEPGLQRCFERHGAYEMFQELKLIFQENARIERYEVSNSSTAARWRRIVLLVNIYSECLGTTTT